MAKLVAPPLSTFVPSRTVFASYGYVSSTSLVASVCVWSDRPHERQHHEEKTEKAVCNLNETLTVHPEGVLLRPISQRQHKQTSTTPTKMTRHRSLWSQVRSTCESCLFATFSVAAIPDKLDAANTSQGLSQTFWNCSITSLDWLLDGRCRFGACTLLTHVMGPDTRFDLDPYPT